MVKSDLEVTVVLLDHWQKTDGVDQGEIEELLGRLEVLMGG